MNCLYMRGSFSRMTSLGDLRVIGQRNPVPSRQLHPVGVVALHESLAIGIEKPPALTTHCLRHEHAGHLLRSDHARGMELYELHSGDPGTRL
jgi:hypothetical protein